MDSEFRVRRAQSDDQAVIKRLVRAARINPLGLDWRRFVVAVDPAGAVIGAGQVKPHPDGTCELASIVVRPKWRGRGVARAIIEQLMRESEPPLWLMCRSSLRGLYHRFGFGEVVEAGDMPPNFRRMRRLAGALEFLAQHGEYLAVMVWRARDADREREA